ncbi:MAG: MFS transporter [Oscillospiraceae bacterium]|jgi:OFA family oxalate/formate antiporter-like MFS transporter|nr:MFS transporter [Oscillospiraceae bacterium]
MGGIAQNKQGLKMLFAGAALQLFLGIIYVWSVFKNPVSAYYGWAASDAGLTASFMLCFFVVGIFTGGKLQMKIGAKLTTLLGGLSVASGMLATSFIPAKRGLPGEIERYVTDAPVFLLYVFYGIIGGFGVGMGFNAIISTAQKWFPKNRGFASGVAVGSFGLSTVIFAPFAELLIEKFDINIVFMVLAGVFAIATLLFFSFIKTPDQVANASPPPLVGKQYTTLEMVKTPRYYLVALSLMLGTSVFFVINPDLKDLAAERGLANFATALVMFTGVCNALGRIFAPLASDKIGRENADIAVLAVTAVCAFSLCFAEGILLMAIIALVAFCFGGYAGLYPVLTSENFGIKNIGANYGAVMLGFMASSLLFPIIMNKIDDRILRFAALGVIAVIGAVLVLALKIVNSKTPK